MPKGSTEQLRSQPTVAVAAKLFLLIVGGACVAAAAIRATECCSRVADPRAAEMFGALVLGIAFSSIALLSRRPLVSRVAGEVALLAAVLVTVEVAVTATRPANGRKRGIKRPCGWACRSTSGPSLKSWKVCVPRGSTRYQASSEAGPGKRGCSATWPQDSIRCHTRATRPLSSAMKAVISSSTGLTNSGSTIHMVWLRVGTLPSRSSESRLRWVTVFHRVGRPWTSFARRIHGRPTFPWPAHALSLSSARFASTWSRCDHRSFSGSWTVNLRWQEKEERDNVKLARYLDPSFSQGLAERQNETDAVVRRLAPPIRAQDNRLAQQEVQRPWVERFSNLYALSYVRQSLNPMTNWRSPVPPPDLMLFKQCLQLAQQAAAAWGGKLLVVNLPSYAEVTGQEPEALSHRTVVEIVADIGLPLIDGGGIVPVTRRSGGSLCTANGIPSKRRRARVAGASDPRGTRSDPRTAPRRRPLVNIAQGLQCLRISSQGFRPSSTRCSVRPSISMRRWSVWTNHSGRRCGMWSSSLRSSASSACVSTARTPRT